MSSSTKLPTRPRDAHPLCGANLSTLRRVTREAGPLAAGRGREIRGAFAAAAGRLPFSLLEKAYVAMNRGRAAQSPAPIFILGHWRSGTTHLYNVLSKAPHFGFVSPFATALPWDFLVLGRLLEPLLTRKLPEHRFIDRIPVTPDAPQEDEIAVANMTPMSFYHALYFPAKFRHFFDRGLFFDGAAPREIEDWKEKLRYLYLKLAIAQPDRRLLIKNPVYTARVDVLREIWPDAKFIHIHRNPFKVFPSMRNFYEALFAQFALQDASGVDIQEVVLSTYERMMNSISKHTKDLPVNQFVELRFDDFQENPLREIEAIYDQLELPGFETVREPFREYLDSVSDYKKNKYEQPSETIDTIARRWQPFIERWGYRVPA